MIQFFVKLLFRDSIQAETDRVAAASRQEKLRSLRVYLISLVCVLGAPTALLFWLTAFVGRYWPHLNRPHRPGFFEFIATLAAVGGTFLAGLFLGAAVAVVVLGRFHGAAEMTRIAYFDAPLYGPFIRWLIHKTAKKSL